MLVMEHPTADDTLRTRVSLINRVKNLSDDRSWVEFLSRYQRVVQSLARSRGLTEHEAEDVAQEVFKRIAATIGEFCHAARPGSFRSWLFQLTRWRADDKMRERARHVWRPLPSASGPGGSPDRTPTLEQAQTPAEIERAFEAEAQRHMIETLFKAIERSVTPKQVQIFQLLVIDETPVDKVAELYQITPAAVYVIKHRVIAKLQAEVKRLQLHME
jgi:RNA polymerase sigma factor (sigma-70 family)